MSKLTQHEIWEGKYADGHTQLAPWDHIVSFIFRNKPKDKKNSEVKILEICCGTASNLFFAAQVGFNVSGLDFSDSAINFAKKRFADNGLVGDLQVGDARELPFENNSFDLAIDRAGLTSCPTEIITSACKEVHRVLKKEGKFFFNPYSTRSSSAASGKDANVIKSYLGGYRDGISDGTLTGIGCVNFFSDSDVQKTLCPLGFEIMQMQHMEYMDFKDPLRTMHAEWRIISQKV